ncbi:uridylate kinase [methane-oxidizing endosymbiont of Gigantopelta aegis]|uniref:amino acid kinase family protein n=1 Tax=methane-oxidizing endosymbiont of Gigantopelta aegis TaxID=2794938 RepID=UPI0018DD69E9|nr:uridylate kinase [methane-oxidizing endosymbiont of Gigantopelta aegis]
MTTVIKVGGSLAKNGRLSDCLSRIDQYYQQNTVLVPGGGCFADQVRAAQQHWQFDQQTAHHMALLAMQQMALLFKALQPGWHLVSKTKEISCYPNDILIWQPDIAELDAAGVEASWEVTSDSLSAWLAETINADRLIILKSTLMAVSANIDALQQADIVDPAFHRFMHASIPFDVRNYEQL